MRHHIAEAAERPTITDHVARWIRRLCVPIAIFWVAVAVLSNVLVPQLEKVGEERNVAAGLEAHLFPRVFVRGGFRVNTLESGLAGPNGTDRATVYTLGGSAITIRSLIVDAQVTLGSKSGDLGWGIAGRLTY